LFFLIDGPHAGLEFRLDELERARADLLRDGLVDGVSARRFGIMKGTNVDGLPIASSTRP